MLGCSVMFMRDHKFNFSFIFLKNYLGCYIIFVRDDQFNFSFIFFNDYNNDIKQTLTTYNSTLFHNVLRDKLHMNPMNLKI